MPKRVFSHFRLPRGLTRRFFLGFWISCSLPGLLACEEEKPYTPFQVATALPRATPPQAKGESEVVEPKAGQLHGQKAPSKAVQWKIFDRTIRAPEGTFLREAIENPANGSDEVLLWVTPKDASPSPEAGLWLVSSDGRLARKLYAQPEFLPTGEGCQFEPSLRASGPHSVTARLRARCSDRLLPGTPVEVLLVVTPNATQPIPLAFRMLDPAPGERLQVEIDSTDQDGDKVDDAKLSMTLTGPDGVKATLPFLWLLRTAGASRQPDEPQRELSKRTSRLGIAAIRKAERGSVRADAEALKRLLSSVCGELGTSKILLENGAPLKCGAIWPALSQLTEVTVRAELGTKNLHRALGEAERVDWIGQAATQKQIDALRKLLLEKIEMRKTLQLARFNVTTKSLTTAYASPLSFDEQGQLWAQTTTEKTKRLTLKGDPPLVTPATETEPERRIEAPEWNIELAGPSGERLSAALPSCGRSEVQLAFSKPSGTPRAPIPVAILAPRPGNCRKFSGVDLRAVPLSWSGGQLTLSLGGELIQSAGHQRIPPGPFAFSTRFGLAVQSENELVLWQVERPEQHHHCVVGKGGNRVACIKGPSVFVYATASDTADTTKTSEGSPRQPDK